MREQSSSAISPSHYQADGIQCIDITRHMSFAKGNAVKYLWRAGKKDNNSEAQDIKKAMWYLADELNRLGELSDKNMEIIKDLIGE